MKVKKVLLQVKNVCAKEKSRMITYHYEKVINISLNCT